jgi:protein gp37
MSENSKIEWTEKTWNPVTGCDKVSAGCKNCYAETMAKRLQAMGTRGYDGVVNEHGHWTGKINLVPDALDKPLHWRKPQLVFVNSMSDLFHEDVPFDYIDQVFDVMERCPQHTFQILTKRPERLAEYCNLWDELPLPNVWLGTSVEDQPAADKRIPHLLRCPAAVRFLSCEPLLGPLDLEHLPSVSGFGRNLDALSSAGALGSDVPGRIDWVIVGGESGHHARPMHPEWARQLRDQCLAASVPFFFKQWGEWLPGTQYTPQLRERDSDGPCSRFDCLDWSPTGTFCKDGKPGWIAADQFEDMIEPVYRVGKHAAGRLLDGREWNEYPKAQVNV